MKTLFSYFLILTSCNTGLVVNSDGGSLDLAMHQPGVPLYHRAAAAICSMDRTPGGCLSGNPDLGGANCNSDTDCNAGNNGRCGGSRIGCMCSYDTCFSDADCATGTLCSCRGAAGDRPTGVNHCITSNCRTDSDCGSNGYCSPSLDSMCGAYIGVTAWHCHTASDTCTNDTDCGSDGGFSGNWYCGYDPQVSHWTCLQTLCAG